MKINSHRVVVIMPCMNEADNLSIVIEKLSALKPLAIVIGLDPATTDNTRAVAEELGCIVTTPGRSGYDPAVNEATSYALDNFKDSLLLYTDAGDKYGYEQVSEMIAMIEAGDDMVMAVRKDAQNTRMWHQKLGTELVLVLINLVMRQKLRDISPFRLLKSSVFDKVVISPQKFRWPSELLVKSISCGYQVGQIDIISLPRRGSSKVSGSMINSIRAGIEMFSSLQFYNYKKGVEDVTVKN